MSYSYEIALNSLPNENDEPYNPFSDSYSRLYAARPSRSNSRLYQEDYTTPAKSDTYHEHPSKEKPAHDRSRWRHLRESWWLELGSCIFSLLCLLSIFGILLGVNNKPLAAWNLPISPNALISFLSTIATSSFLLAISEVLSQLKWKHFDGQINSVADLEHYDAASRGSLGSLQFLYKHHVRTLLASSAAVVVALSLLVNPFSQLVISFPTPTRPNLDGASSSFATTRLYDPHSTLMDANGLSMSAGSVDTRMKAALIEGFFNEPIVPDFNCPTGNCTWTDVTTLGICGGCRDITSLIETSCGNTFMSDFGNYSLHGCNYTMPGGITLQGSWKFQGGNGLYSATRWNSSAGSVATQKPGDQLIFAGLQAIQLNNLDYTKRDTLPEPIASECVLSLCTVTRDYLNVTNGSVTSAPAKGDLLLIKSPGSQCENCSQSQFMMDLQPQDEAGGQHQLDHDAPVYQFNQANYGSIGAYMREMFSTGWWDKATYPSTRQYTLLLPSAPDMGRELANSANLNETMQSIAAAMTEVIRTSPNSTMVQGVTLITQTYIHVRFAWLGMPLALVVLSIALLLTTIVITRKRDMPSWKGSSLAMLFHHCTGWDDKMTSFNDISDLDHRAASMKGTLSREVPMSFVRSR